MGLRLSGVDSAPKYNVVLCLTPKDVKEAVKKALSADVFGLDTETTGCDPRIESPVGKARAFSVQLAVGNTCYFIPTFELPNTDVSFVHLIDHLKPLLRQKQEKAVFSNAAYDFHVFANHGIRPVYGCLAGDTQVMSFTLDSSLERHGLKELAKRLLEADTVEFRQTFSIPKLKKDGKPGKAMRLPDLIEATTAKETHIKALFKERAQAFAGKLSGVKQAARRLVAETNGEVTEEAMRVFLYYACLDPIYSLECYHELRTRLEKKPWADGKPLYDYYMQFEVPQTICLWNMTRRGMRLSKSKLLIAKAKCEEDIVKQLTEFNRLAVKAGADPERMKKFNTASVKDIDWFFTTVVGVKAQTKRRKNGTESVSWDAKTLEKMNGNKKAAPFVKALLGYRKATKILSTYLVPFLRYYEEYGGKVHTNFKQTGTATSRLSSSVPNLQNVPKAGDKDPYGIRECFVADEGEDDPDDEDQLLVGDIDQAQVEARLTAAFSGDETMLAAIREGLDMHSLTAVKAVPEVREYAGTRTVDKQLLTEVKEKFPDARQKTKVVNFSVIYGTGAKGLSETLECSEDFAQGLIDGFFETYPKVKKFLRKMHEFAREHGYVRSLLRRYMYCKDAQSSIRAIRARGERQSANYKVQGSQADMMKISMPKIDQDRRLREMGVQVRLQIHDELVFTVPRKYAAEAKVIIDDYVSHPLESCGFKPLAVETPADVSYGRDWSSAKG